MVPSCFWKACLGALVCLFLLAGPAQGSAQQFTQSFYVDCSNPSAQPPQFSSISAAVGAATDGTSIYVPPGMTCAENVTIGYLKNIAIATDWMATFNLIGKLTIQSSHTVEIQGMVVSNPINDAMYPPGVGIVVNSSTDVTLAFVQSVNNIAGGLAISTSDVTINGAGTFSNNGATGINAGSNSTLYFNAWGGNVDISNNTGIGLNADRSVVGGYGNMTINNTRAVPGATPPNGVGINEFGGAKAGIFAGFGPISISSNAGGGVLLWETSELSLGGNISWATNPVTVQGNGAVGITAVYGSSLTLFGTQVTGHTTAGISLYGNSQAAIAMGSASDISGNGTGTGPGRAGIVVEQGSQALVSGATIQNNGGPGILGLVHATLDVESSTFSSNAGGAIVCDQSTALATDLPHSALGSANACTVAPPGNHGHGVGNMSLGMPNWQFAKARSIKLNSMILSHHLNATTLAK